VRFGADGPIVEAARGATILDAARAAGFFIDSLCGGDGHCGKCRVVVREGNVSGGAAAPLTPEEIAQGFALACLARIEDDALIDIPERSLLREPAPHSGDLRVSRGAGFADEGAVAELDPLVRRLSLRVATPTLENNAADFDRLETAARAALPPNAAIRADLDVLRALPAALRLSDGAVSVTVAWSEGSYRILEIAPAEAVASNLAVALDVGTTTLAAHLVDLTTGATLAAALRYNGQAAYGADVIRRIIWCDSENGGLERLQGITAADVNAMIEDMCEKAGHPREEITAIAAAGNTTMIHLLLGVTPRWIRREPYTGAMRQPPPVRASGVGLAIHPAGLLYCLPSVSGFVGADITAGVMACGLDVGGAVRMLVDIGTNGEIVIGNKDWMVAASASAGPAFEGAGNRDGMRATAGAIDHVGGLAADGALRFTAIGGAPPVGFCGTAYVDLLAELLRAAVMDKAGKFNAAAGSDRLRENSDGTPEFVVVRAGESGAERDLAITRDDVANLMRAKAAIYAAIKVLLRSVGLRFDDIEEVLVAGAFGAFLDMPNAVSIGLLPDLPAARLRFAGNTSLQGAKMAALSVGHYNRARRIADKMTYFELSTDPNFMDEFAAACFFPHTHIEEFPSVRSGRGASGVLSRQDNVKCKMRNEKPRMRAHKA